MVIDSQLNLPLITGSCLKASGHQKPELPINQVNQPLKLCNQIVQRLFISVYQWIINPSLGSRAPWGPTHPRGALAKIDLRRVLRRPPGAVLGPGPPPRSRSGVLGWVGGGRHCALDLLGQSFTFIFVKYIQIPDTPHFLPNAYVFRTRLHATMCPCQRVKHFMPTNIMSKTVNNVVQQMLETDHSIIRKSASASLSPGWQLHPANLRSKLGSPIPKLQWNSWAGW